jgi:hypothetical protein
METDVPVLGSSYRCSPRRSRSPKIPSFRSPVDLRFVPFIFNTCSPTPDPRTPRLHHPLHLSRPTSTILRSMGSTASFARERERKGKGRNGKEQVGTANVERRSSKPRRGTLAEGIGGTRRRMAQGRSCGRGRSRRRWYRFVHIPASVSFSSQ